MSHGGVKLPLRTRGVSDLVRPKVLALMGGPRKGENTDTLLDAVLKGMENEGAKVEKVYLADLDYEGCRACLSCEETGRCILDDDYSMMYDKYDKADCVVVATPIYFHSVSSQLKAAVDRTQAFWASKYVLGKPSIDTDKIRLGLFLATAGAKDGSFEAAESVVRIFFKAINTRYWDEILMEGTDERRVDSRKELLEEAFGRGAEMVRAWRFELSADAGQC